jgi:hypothetical protein
MGKNIMRRQLYIVSLLVVGSVINGCAGNLDLIAKTSVSTRQGIFLEAQSTQPIQDKALLTVDFSVKAKSGVKHKDVKGAKSEYSAILNIDGQVIELTDNPTLEKLNGSYRENPEAGTGWRYHFKKVLLLQPGKHHISFAVPASDVISEKEFELLSGENILKIIPKYTKPISRYPTFPKFSKGLYGVTMIIINKET